MSSIGSVGQLVAVIQAQLARQGKVQGAGRPRSPAKTAKETTARGSLTQLIARRVAQIDADDPERGRKAFRAFLEAVLLVQLGEQLQRDPAFHLMVDDIQRVMEKDAQCAPLVDEAIGHLLNQTGARK